MTRRTHVLRAAVGAAAALVLSTGTAAAFAPAAMATPAGVTVYAEEAAELALDLTYDALVVEPGQTGSASLTGADAASLPAGAEFTLGNVNTPDGVFVTVNEDSGRVTVGVDPEAKAGSEFEVPVTLSYSIDNPEYDAEVEGSQPTLTVTQELSLQVTVQDAPPVEGTNAENYEVTYPASEGVRGTTLTVAPVVAPPTLPERTIFAFNAASVPTGIEIDSLTGEITLAIPDDQAVRSISLPVRVTYPDGSRDFTTLKVTVVNAPGDDTGTIGGGSLGGSDSLGSLTGSLG